MAAWKLLLLGAKLRRSWKRIPPEQRRKIVEGAGTTLKEKGPKVARTVGTVVKNARKAR